MHFSPLTSSSRRGCRKPTLPKPTPCAVPPASRLTSLHLRSDCAFALTSPSRAAARRSPIRSALLRAHNESSCLERVQPDACFVRPHVAFRERATSLPHGRAALSSGVMSAAVLPQIRTYAWPNAPARFHSPSTLSRDDATALLAAAPATIPRGFTSSVRPSDELGHPGYPRLLPECTAAFHRELRCPELLWAAAALPRAGTDPLS